MRQKLVLRTALDPRPHHAAALRAVRAGAGDIDEGQRVVPGGGEGVGGCERRVVGDLPVLRLALARRRDAQARRSRRRRPRTPAASGEKSEKSEWTATRSFGCSTASGARTTASTLSTRSSSRHSRSTPWPIMPEAPNSTTFIATCPGSGAGRTDACRWRGGRRSRSRAADSRDADLAGAEHAHRHRRVGIVEAADVDRRDVGMHGDMVFGQARVHDPSRTRVEKGLLP